MKITWLGFLFSLIFVLFPLYFIYRFDLRSFRRFLVAALTMTGSVAVTALGIYLLTVWNNVFFTILSGVVMAIAGAVFSIRKAKLKVGRLFVPVLCGVIIAVFIVGLYALLLVLGLKTTFHARFFVPVFGLLAGSVIGPNARALRMYYMGLTHHNQLYYYLLGNGSSHREATSHFVKRAFQSALNIMIRQMSALVFANAPVLMLALILTGTDVLTAALLQILLFFMVLTVSFVSLCITLLVARHYNYDEYERLRPVQKGTSASTNASQSSTSSTNLSTQSHTGFENQPQESTPESHLPV